MCSTCDCDQSNKIESKETTEKDNRCRKCGSQSFVVLDKVHMECKDCFLESCNKKLRSTIGKSKLLRNNDSILIAHSGGASSSALLDLIKQSMEYETRREQKFRPSVLHVDTNLKVTLEDRVKNLQSILELTGRLYPSWPIYWTALELSSLQPDCDTQELYFRYDPRRDFTGRELESIFDRVRTLQTFSETLEKLDLTDCQQRIQSCLIDLVSRTARQINSTFESTEDYFRYVFTGSSATQLANNLLVDVILGNGSHIKSSVSICDQRQAIPILRPMRDFSKKEIAFYLKARNIHFHLVLNDATFADRKASIQKLTESFLSKLYVDYPSTYNTLLRTGNKMQE